MKNKAQTTFISLLILSILATFLVYMYLYTPKIEETEALAMSNATLAERVATLEKFQAAMPKNLEQMALMTEEINEKLEYFPVDVKEEDAIALALRTWEEEILVAYKSIGINEKENMAVIPVETVQAAGVEGYDELLSFDSRKVTYTNMTTYGNMKALIDSFNANQEEMAITSITYTQDDDGFLNGSVDATFYMVSGTDKEYVPREFADYELGGTERENLFKDLEDLVNN